MQPKDAVLDYKTSIRSLINDNDMTMKLYQLQHKGFKCFIYLYILPCHETTNDISVNP